MSSACRIDCSLSRYTIAAPADSTVATVARSSASSRSSGPGTTTVRSACTRKWSIGLGSARVIALTAGAGSPASLSRGPAGPADRPATTRPTRVGLGQQIGDGSRLQPAGPARAPPGQRRRGLARVDNRHRGGKLGEHVQQQTGDPVGAAVENSESDRAPYGLASGPRLPINAGRPGRSSQVVARKCHRSAAANVVNRSAETVGANMVRHCARVPGRACRWRSGRPRPRSRGSDPVEARRCRSFWPAV